MVLLVVEEYGVYLKNVFFCHSESVTKTQYNFD